MWAAEAMTTGLAHAHAHFVSGMHACCIWRQRLRGLFPTPDPLPPPPLACHLLPLPGLSVPGPPACRHACVPNNKIFMAGSGDGSLYLYKYHYPDQRKVKVGGGVAGWLGGWLGGWVVDGGPRQSVRGVGPRGEGVRTGSRLRPSGSGSTHSVHLQPQPQPPVRHR